MFFSLLYICANVTLHWCNKVCFYQICHGCSLLLKECYTSANTLMRWPFLTFFFPNMFASPFLTPNLDSRCVTRNGRLLLLGLPWQRNSKWWPKTRGCNIWLFLTLWSSHCKADVAAYSPSLSCADNIVWWVPCLHHTRRLREIC